MSADPDPIKILTTDAEVAGWNSDGLPNDQVQIARVFETVGLTLLETRTKHMSQKIVFSRRTGFNREWSHRHKLGSVASHYRSPASGEFHVIICLLRKN